MSLEGQYADDNVFARIVRGEIPAARVFEDDDTLALMDAFPQARGHTLVIHKRSRARNLLETNSTEWAAVSETARRVARAVRAALDPAGIMVSQLNGTAAGQTIFHLHVHIIPRWDGVALAGHGQGMADPAELRALAAQIADRMAA